MASAKPVAPHSGVSDAITLAVARAIKPTLNVGDLAITLKRSKNTSDDRKVFVLVPAPGGLARAMLFPSSAVDATVLSGETLVSTLTRSDTTAQTSRHTSTDESVTGDNLERQLRIGGLIAGILRDDVLELAPKRTITSLINAIYDAMIGTRLDSTSEEIEAPTGPFALVFDDAGDGSLKFYDGATAGTLTGKLADVDQVEEEEDPLNSDW